MHSIMANRMQQHDIFEYMYTQVSTNMTRKFGEATDNMTNHVIEMCADMQRQVLMARGAESEALKSPQNDLARVRAILDRARQRLEDIRADTAPVRRDAADRGWID